MAELRKRVDECQRGGILSAESAAKMLAVLDASVGVGDVSTRVQALLKLAAAETADDGNAPLPRLYFDRHLYAPLFVDQPFAERNGQLALFGRAESGVRMAPPALVESEARFVFDLREFWKTHAEETQWKNHEIFLLRNQARTGLGFFTGAGFYPDFLLWLKRGKRQVLCFVEPKGLGRAWPQAKIDLLASIAGHSPPDLPLRGFTVTPTPLAEILALQPGVNETALAAMHILLQSDSGGPSGYIDDLLAELQGALFQ